MKTRCKRVLFVLVVFVCAACAFPGTKNTVDSPEIPPGEGVVVARLHSNWPGGYLLDGVTIHYGELRRDIPGLIHSPKVSKMITLQPELSVNTLPAGRYEWWYLHLPSCDYFFKNMWFNVDPNAINYIGDLYVDVKQDSQLGLATFDVNVVLKDDVGVVREMFTDNYPVLAKTYVFKESLTDTTDAEWAWGWPGVKPWNCKTRGQPRMG